MDIVSLLLAKRYVDDSLAGAGALKGKSAYEVAQANGFTGSEKDWLVSLVGVTPHIGENGHWFIDTKDTGVIASPDLAGYATENYIKNEISKIDLTPYAKKTDIPDVTDLISQKELQQAINNIEHPVVDLTGYATKSFVELKYNEILDSIPTPPSYDEIIFDGGEIE